MEQNPWIPWRKTILPDGSETWGPHPKQRQFLLLADYLDILFGGAAGGGKSDALLMASAQYVDTPGYAALLLRQSFPDLMQPDALIPRSKEWWSGKADWNAQQRRWTFPSGATITFGYLERDDDVYQYQGAAYQFIGIDELTQHTETRCRYLFSRLRRRAGVDVPLRFRAGSNPGGRGHDWVKRQYLDSSAPDRAFVPSKLQDNPSLDEVEYLRSLSHLDSITRQQLLGGDWNAYEGGRFKRAWFRYFTRRGDYYVLDDKAFLPDQLKLIFLTVDTAASVKTSADYTVISAWAITRDNRLLWLDCHRGRWEVPDILPEIQMMYRKHGAAFVGIEAVAGHSGTGVYQLAKRSSMIVRSLSPKGQDKLVRATPAIILAESGRLWLPATRPPWVDDAEAEMIRFTGDPAKDANDDQVDTLSYAVQVLSGQETGEAFAPYVAGGTG